MMVVNFTKLVQEPRISFVFLRKTVGYVMIVSFLWQNVLWAMGEHRVVEEDLRSPRVSVTADQRMAIVEPGSEQNGVAHNVFPDFQLAKDSGVIFQGTSSTRVICNRIYNEESPISLSGVIEASIPVVMANPGGIAVEGLDCQGFPHLAVLAGHMAQTTEGLAYEVRDGKVTVDKTIVNEEEQLKSLALAGRTVRVSDSLLSPALSLTVLAGAKVRPLERDEEQEEREPAPSAPDQASKPFNSIVLAQSTVLQSERIFLQSDEVAGRILANGVLHSTHEGIVIRALGDVYVNDLVSLGNLDIETTGRVFLRGVTRVGGRTRIKASYFQSDKEFVSLKGLLLDVSHAMTFRDNVEIGEAFEARGGELTFKRKASAPQASFFTLESLKVGRKAVFSALGEGLKGTIGSVLSKGKIEVSALSATFKHTLFELGSVFRTRTHFVLRGETYHNKGTVFTCCVHDAIFTESYTDSGTFYGPTLLLLTAPTIRYTPSHTSYLRHAFVTASSHLDVKPGGRFTLQGNGERIFLQLASGKDIVFKGVVRQFSTDFPLSAWFTCFGKKSPASLERLTRAIASVSLAAWEKEIQFIRRGMSRSRIVLQAGRDIECKYAVIRSETTDVGFIAEELISLRDSDIEPGYTKGNAASLRGRGITGGWVHIGSLIDGSTKVEGTESVFLCVSRVSGPRDANVNTPDLKCKDLHVLSSRGNAFAQGTQRNECTGLRVEGYLSGTAEGRQVYLRSSRVTSAAGAASVQRPREEARPSRTPPRQNYNQRAASVVRRLERPSREGEAILEDCVVQGGSAAQIEHRNVSLINTRATSPGGRARVEAERDLRLVNSRLDARLDARATGRNVASTSSTVESKTGRSAVVARHSATLERSTLRGRETFIEAKRGAATLRDTRLEGKHNRVVAFQVEDSNTASTGSVSYEGDASVQSHNLRAAGAVAATAAYVGFTGTTRAASLQAEGHRVATEDMAIQGRLDLRGNVVTQRGHTEAQDTFIQARDQLEDSKDTSNTARGSLILDIPNNLDFKGHQTADTVSVAPLRMDVNDILEKTTARVTDIHMPEADVVIDKLTHAHTTLVLSARRLETKATLIADGDFIARIREQILQKGLIEADSVSMSAAHISVETPVERKAVRGGYQDVLGAPAITRARKGDVDVEATDSLQTRGAKFEAKMSVRLSSQRSLYLGAQYCTSEIQTGDGKNGTHLYTSVPHKTHIVAGVDVDVSSGQDMTLQGLDIAAGRDIQIRADGGFTDEGVTPLSQRTTTHTQKSWWRKSTRSETETVTGFDPNGYHAGRGIFFTLGQGGSFQAPVLESVEGPKIQSNGKMLLFSVGESTRTVHRQATGKNPFFHTYRDQGDATSSVVMAKVTSPDGLLVSGADHMGVEVRGQGDLDKVLAHLATDPQTAWIQGFQGCSDVSWCLVPEVNKHWNRRHRQTAPELAIGISVVASVATMGLGLPATVAGAMVSAAIATAASQTALSLLNHGDLRDLGTISAAQNLVISVVTAGLTKGINQALDQALSGSAQSATQGATQSATQGATKSATQGATQGATQTATQGATQSVTQSTTQAVQQVGQQAAQQTVQQTWMQAFTQAARQTAIQSGVSVTLRAMTQGDMDLKQVVLQGAATAAASGLASLGAKAIGDFYQGSSSHPSPLVGEGGAYAPGEGFAWVTHTALHGALGFGLGAASDIRNPLRGGAGGAIGAVLGETVAPLLPSTWSPEVRVAVSGLGGTAAALLTGQDVNAAALAAINAAENNSEAHKERPPSPRTRAAQEVFEDYTELYERRPDLQDKHRQMGYSAEHFAQSTYKGTERKIAEDAVGRYILGQKPSAYELQVIKDCAVAGGISLTTDVAVGLGLGVAGKVVPPLFSAATKTTRSAIGKLSTKAVSWSSTAEVGSSSTSFSTTTPYLAAESGTMKTARQSGVPVTLELPTSHPREVPLLYGNGAGGLVESVSTKPLQGVHGNSSAYIGDTHVYVIRDAEGRIWKVGESMRGVNKVGLSKRAEAQVSKLRRETGIRFESDVRRTFTTKAEARAYETELIERYRRMFGQDLLPGNKGNR